MENFEQVGTNQQGNILSASSEKHEVKITLDLMYHGAGDGHLGAYASEPVNVDLTIKVWISFERGAGEVYLTIPRGGTRATVYFCYPQYSCDNAYINSAQLMEGMVIDNYYYYFARY